MLLYLNVVFFLKHCFWQFPIHFQLGSDLDSSLVTSVLSCWPWMTFERWHGAPPCINILHWWMWICRSSLFHITCTIHRCYLRQEVEFSFSRFGHPALNHLAWWALQKYENFHSESFLNWWKLMCRTPPRSNIQPKNMVLGISVKWCLHSSTSLGKSLVLLYTTIAVVPYVDMAQVCLKRNYGWSQFHSHEGAEVLQS